MKRSTILARLAETGIRQEAEKVVPANGAPVPLPYHVVRVDEVEDGDDLGRVRIKTLTWAVALFTKNKDFALERKMSPPARVAWIETPLCTDGKKQTSSRHPRVWRG